jgi:hypothetical protein
MPRFIIKNFMRDAFTAAENDIGKFAIPGTDAEAFINRLIDRTMLTGIVGGRMLTTYPLTVFKILGVDNRLYRDMESWMLRRLRGTGAKIEAAMKGDREIIKNLELNGLVGETMYRDSASIAQIVENAYKHPGIGKNSASVLLNWGNPLRSIEALGSIVERVPRVHAALRGVKSGMPIEDAAVLGRQLTADFSDVSYVNRFINEFSPFWSATFAGEYAAYRALKTIPKKFLAKVVTGVTLPTIGIVAWNMADKDRREKFLALDPIQRASFWHIFYGDKAENHLQIVKPYGVVNAVFTALPELAATAAATDGFLHNPNIQGDLMAAVKMAMPSLPIPPILQTPAEEVSNRNFYFDKDIVPRYIRSAAASAKVKPSDTEVDKYASLIVNDVLGKVGIESSIAPANVAHAVQGYAGPLGTGVDRLLSKGIKMGQRASGVKLATEPKRDITDISFINAVVGKDPLLTPYTRWMEQFYDIYDKTDRANTAINRIEDIEPKDRNKAERFDYQRYKKDAELYDDIESDMEEIRDLWDEAMEIKNTDIIYSDPKVKIEQLRLKHRAMNEIGSKAVFRYNREKYK